MVGCGVEGSVDVELSLAEKRLLLALPADGSPKAAAELDGFATSGEALRAAGAPQRHGLVEVTEESTDLIGLTGEGKQAKRTGLPERRALSRAQDNDGPLPLADLKKEFQKDPQQMGIAIGWLKRKGWADLKDGAVVLQEGSFEETPDEVLLKQLRDGFKPLAPENKEAAATLEDRQLLERKSDTTRFLALTTAGKKYVKSLDADALAGADEVNQVTPELIARWAEMTEDEKAKVHLRRFDFDVPVAERAPGKTHPLSQMLAQIRDIFWKMGFQEIAGDYVESAFWNMDALFIPQDHPAREMQDTFYLAEPATLPVAEDDLERGKAVHLDGGDTGSTGWGGAFDEAVSRRGLLRTHTTNTTVRYLHEHPEGEHKVFGLGKVFRKETMDATHLPEFYQIEGIVTEPGADFNMLVGLCKVFFGAMGFPEVRFRPAYFPYTEPSMEIDVHYNGKWMELGGCGVFRPEVTEPLGCEHPVLAWGFGLERLAMMRLGLTDIRDLYVSDLRWLKDTPLQ